MNHLTTLFFLLLSCAALGQKSTTTLQGNVVDDQLHPLMGATVVLLQQTDSVIAKFNITNEAGGFKLAKVQGGDYILQVSYLGFGHYSKPLTLDGRQPVNDIGSILMLPASAVLDEVVIKAEHVPMVVNGDTLEYNAAAFKVAPNDAVEDLLKKLPGIEVARDGSIKAQGEKVDKVMVDGKEFFGNDPTIATRNLPADAIDKVQVFDKKSEMAEFSGIDDGMEQKTINLELKDDKKKGYFGNATAGYGTDDRYTGKFNLNRFGKKTQLSAIGMANNVNDQGFSFNDYISFMGGLGNFMSGGGLRITMDGDGGGLPLNLNGQDGITTTRAGGLNFNTDFTDRTELNASYFYNNAQNALHRTIDRENLFGDQSFATRDESEKATTKTNHRLNFTLKHEIDSMQNLTFRGNGSVNQSRFDEVGSSNTFANNGLANGSFRDYFTNQEGFQFSSSLVYRRKFGKAGRIFSGNVSYQQDGSNQKGQVFSINDFYEGLTLPSFSDTLRQRQVYDTRKEGFGFRLSYTEPLGKGKYLEINASRQQYENEQEKQFFDLFSGEEVSLEGLNNHYVVDYIYHRAGSNFRMNTKKMNFSSGVSLQQALLYGKIFSQENPVNGEYLYLLPEMTFRYDFKTTRNLSLEYRTEVREPTIQELQPVVDNSNPLSIYQGNPDLKPEYAHTLSAFFMNYDQFSFTNIFFNAMATYTRDKITTAQSIDEYFVRYATPVNVENDFALQGTVSFSTPIRPIKTRISLSTDWSYNRSIVFVNELQNNAVYKTAAFDLSLDNRNKKVVDATVGANFKFNHTIFSVSEQFNQAFSSQTYYVDVALDLAEKWQVNSSFDYQVFSNEAFGQQLGIPLWTAEVSRFVMKKKGEIKFSVFDLLNKNEGINRVSRLNYTQEERIQSLGRYFMLSFAYSISGFGEDHAGIEVKMSRRR